MSTGGMSQRAVYAAAVDDLADRALGALRGTEGSTVLAGSVRDAADIKAALAAVRVLGPDVFAPTLFSGARCDPTDAEVVAEAFRVFPPEPDAAPETAWRDWATASLLARLGDTVLVEAPDAPANGFWRETRWRQWSVHMAQLSPMALPELDSAVHDDAFWGVRALSRGVVRAILRGDYPTAARLARWLAWACGRGLRPALDVVPMLRHIELHDGSGARTRLQIGIAYRLLEQWKQSEGP